MNLLRDAKRVKPLSGLTADGRISSVETQMDVQTHQTSSAAVSLQFLPDGSLYLQNLPDNSDRNTSKRKKTDELLHPEA